MNDMNRESFLYPETMDYYDNYAEDDDLTNHLKLIREAKKAVNIPIIASVNCVSAEKWPYYAEILQDAGADALELNIFILPSDFSRTSEQNEQVYFDVVNEVKKYVKIPVSLKISYYNSDLGNLIQRLSKTDIKGLVLFNRFYSPDIDINNMEVLSTNVFSAPSEISIPLRWVAIMAGRVNCDIAASTGIHDGSGVVKQILAGAQVVQVASVFYKKGKGHLEEMLKDLETWMKEKSYKKLDDFRGNMSQEKSENPAVYERVQFMKYFSGKGL